MTQRFQNLLGMVRWAVELGRLDILHEVSKLSSYNAMPREGHLQALYRIFCYLKSCPKSKILFNARQTEPKAQFTDYDWDDYYPDAEELLPHNAPRALEVLR